MVAKEVGGWGYGNKNKTKLMLLPIILWHLWQVLYNTIYTITIIGWCNKTQNHIVQLENKILNKVNSLIHTIIVKRVRQEKYVYGLRKLAKKKKKERASERWT